MSTLKKMNAVCKYILHNYSFLGIVIWQKFTIKQLFVVNWSLFTPVEMSLKKSHLIYS